MKVQSDNNIITVPNMSAKELVTWSQSEMREAGLPFGCFENRAVPIIERDLESVKGKRLKALWHHFVAVYWATREGRDYQAKQGFDGNVAALLVYAVQIKRRGCFVSLVESDFRRPPWDFRRPRSDAFCVPEVYVPEVCIPAVDSGRANCSFGLRLTRGELEGHYGFVGFHEI